MVTKTESGEITYKQVEKFRSDFVSDPNLKLAMNAATRCNLQEIALNRDVLNDVNFCFSHEIESKGGITDQKRSSTCWMYAELNWLRTITMKKFSMESIEFSQNYIMFWDKIEKANYFLEQMILLRDKDLDDRKIHFLLKEPIPDGGEWHMMANVIKKYGLVPTPAMLPTPNLEASRFINEILGYKVREGAYIIRKMHESGHSLKEIREKKNEILEEAYRILAICFGVPPVKFDWCYRDKDKKYHQDIDITPRQFYKKYVGLNVDQTYTLGNCPAYQTPFNKTYTVELFYNMVGGIGWKWLNIEMPEIKKIAIKMLKNQEAVLYGCDVRQLSHSKEGILHHNLYDYETLFKTSFNMDKATRLDYGQSTLTHSMVLVGVDLVNNKPVRWKVENSWGTEVGKKGFFIMSDEWFDEYTYDLIVPQKYMPEKLLKLFKQAPIVLPPWHCMV